MNKKRIQIVVQPADNGYTIQGNASDHPTGQNAKAINLIANNGAEVQQHITDFLEEVFNPAEPPKPLGSGPV